MNATFKLLEERIVQAVERLKALKAEREGLEREQEQLRARLEASGGGIGDSPEGAARLDEVEQALREAVRELRGE